MFVRRAKYDQACSMAASMWNELMALRKQWNELVERINASGGEAFLAGASFSPAEIDTLIKLCHPDKHGGSKAANDMTTRLLELRRELKKENDNGQG